MSNIQTIFVQVIRKPERLCIIRRGRCAEDYFPYCEEVSCDVWGILMSMKSLCGEPVSMWLPERYKKPNTSTYVQGVEVEPDYMGIIPEGFDIIHLPEAEYLQFQESPARWRFSGRAKEGNRNEKGNRTGRKRHPGHRTRLRLL